MTSEERKKLIAGLRNEAELFNRGDAPAIAWVFTTAAAELERLGEVVDKLQPAPYDGGWMLDPAMLKKLINEINTSDEVWVGSMEGVEQALLAFCKCYSTRAAAEAAREVGNG